MKRHKTWGGAEEWEWLPSNRKHSKPTQLSCGLANFSSQRLSGSFVQTLHFRLDSSGAALCQMAAAEAGSQSRGHQSVTAAALTANFTSATWHRGSYLPLGNGGKATDFNFLSSAAVKQFLTVSSSCSSHLSEPHCGMWQWMTNFAARPLDWVSAANTNENITFSLEQKPPCNDLSIQCTFLITSPHQRITFGIKVHHNAIIARLIIPFCYFFGDQRTQGSFG